MPRPYCAALSLVGALAFAPTAFAAPITVTDTMDSAATYHGSNYGSFSSPNFVNRVAGGRNWGDEIGSTSHPFDTTQVTVNRDDSTKTLRITMRTRFDGSDLGAHYADIFIDTSTPDSPDTFGYAIALGYQTKAPGLYMHGASATSNDIWSGTSYIYGGAVQLKTTQAGYDPNMAINPPVRLTAGTQMTDYSVSTSLVALGGGLYDFDINMAALTDLPLFNAFDLFWGTADCSNDAIWGSFRTATAAPLQTPVPAPASLWLLGLGLFLVPRFVRKAQVRA